MEGGRFEAAKKEERPYRLLDRKSPEILEALRNAPVYEKHVLVRARRAKDGERIDTKLDDGTEETSNTAHESDWVVMNPQGEEYVVPADEFDAKYTETGAEGVYQARGLCRALPNPYHIPIEIEASWGEPMRGDGQCYIVDACDQNGTPAGAPYLIAGPVFAATYRPAAEKAP